MTHNHGSCPHCGWPVDAPGIRTLSQHRTAHGEVGYRRCLCGAVLVTSAGALVTAVRRGPFG